jgi:hypothetical protein
MARSKKPISPLNIARSPKEVEQTLYKGASKATRHLAAQGAAEMRLQKRAEWARNNLNLPSR